MSSKLYRLGALLLVSAITLNLPMACTPSPKEAMSSPNEIMDQLGRVVKFSGIPQRIVSLAPSNTEILFALGLADRVVAVTDYCDYPPEAKEKPSIGGFSTPNIEKLVVLSPDLILATSIHEERIIPQLEERGMTVFALNPETLEEVLAAITLVGEITGEEEEASELVTEMRNRIKTVTDKAAGLLEEQRPRVLYIVWHDPLMASSSGTLQDDLIEKAGGANIARGLSGYADISLEAVIAANPEVMIASAGMGTGKDLPFQFIKTEPRLRNTDARQSNRVYMIDDNLVSRPGPRIIEGLEKVAEFIHPELFKEAQ